MHLHASTSMLEIMVALPGLTSTASVLQFTRGDDAAIKRYLASRLELALTMKADHEATIDQLRLDLHSVTVENDHNKSALSSAE